ncbi:MAG: hypothetical protein WED13_06345 [Methyloceanibacter sp.]
MRSVIHAKNVEAKLLQLAGAAKANFNPNQPRVPRGNPDGGQWTDAGGGASDGQQLASGTGPSSDDTSTGSSAHDDSHYHVVQLVGSETGVMRVGTDLVPGISVERFDKTGDPLVDTMTELLLNRAALAHVVVGEGAGPLYGTNIHTEFATDLRSQIFQA